MTTTAGVKVPIELPRLETPIRTLWGVPHTDHNDETIEVDVIVRRYSTEPEPFIYLEERDEQAMLRLRVSDAKELIHVLASAVLAAKLQGDVVLPSA